MAIMYPILVSWTFANAKLYTIPDVDLHKKTFAEAKALCSSMGDGVTLFEPKDQATLTAINEKMKTKVWVNVQQVGNSNTFQYSDGTSISSDSSFWKDGEPSSLDEKCVILTPEGKWNDVSCDDTRNVLCQKEIGMYFLLALLK